MVALYTEEMDKLLNYAVANRIRMLGIFPADMIPDVKDLLQVPDYSCFVANTDPSNLPGKHWVLFVANASPQTSPAVEYFDSYGLPLEVHSDLYNSCMRNGILSRITRINSFMLQDISTSVCGYYCTLFAHLRAKGMSFDSAINYLVAAGSSPLQRDNFVLNKVYKISYNASKFCSSSGRFRLPMLYSCIRQNCRCRAVE